MSKKYLLVGITLMLIVVALTGCSQSRALSPPPPPTSGLSQSPSTGQTLPPPSGTTTGYPGPGSTTQPTTSTSGYPIAPLFYDFEDIPVPQEMNIVEDESRVFMVGQFKSGVLVFKGRVEPNSLVDFFQAAMVREKWQFKSGFRYNRSVLVFEKPQKTCVIIIHSHLVYTYLEIYVAPTQVRL
ncbi:MAG: hypothetical protein WHS38_10945 [Thermodesulforhabdaceae bacterium]